MPRLRESAQTKLEEQALENRGLKNYADAKSAILSHLETLGAFHPIEGGLHNKADLTLMKEQQFEKHFGPTIRQYADLMTHVVQNPSDQDEVEAYQGLLVAGINESISRHKAPQHHTSYGNVGEDKYSIALDKLAGDAAAKGSKTEKDGVIEYTMPVYTDVYHSVKVEQATGRVLEMVVKTLDDTGANTLTRITPQNLYYNSMHSDQVIGVKAWADCGVLRVGSKDTPGNSEGVVASLEAAFLEHGLPNPPGYDNLFPTQKGRVVATRGPGELGKPLNKAVDVAIFDKSGQLLTISRFNGEMAVPGGMNENTAMTAISNNQHFAELIEETISNGVLQQWTEEDRANYKILQEALNTKSEIPGGLEAWLEKNVPEATLRTLKGHPTKLFSPFESEAEFCVEMAKSGRFKEDDKTLYEDMCTDLFSKAIRLQDQLVTDPRAVGGAGNVTSIMTAIVDKAALEANLTKRGLALSGGDDAHAAGFAKIPSPSLGFADHAGGIIPAAMVANNLAALREGIPPQLPLDVVRSYTKELEAKAATGRFTVDELNHVQSQIHLADPTLHGSKLRASATQMMHACKEAELDIRENITLDSIKKFKDLGVVATTQEAVLRVLDQHFLNPLNALDQYERPKLIDRFTDLVLELKIAPAIEQFSKGQGLKPIDRASLQKLGSGIQQSIKDVRTLRTRIDLDSWAKDTEAQLTDAVWKSDSVSVKDKAWALASKFSNGFANLKKKFAKACAEKVKTPALHKKCEEWAQSIEDKQEKRNEKFAHKFSHEAQTMMMEKAKELAQNLAVSRVSKTAMAQRMQKTLAEKRSNVRGGGGSSHAVH